MIIQLKKEKKKNNYFPQMFLLNTRDSRLQTALLHHNFDKFAIAKKNYVFFVILLLPYVTMLKKFCCQFYFVINIILFVSLLKRNLLTMVNKIYMIKYGIYYGKVVN